MGRLTGLSGPDTVREQLEAVIVVVRAEPARRRIGAAVTRRAWKNMVFTGTPGTGKSRTADALGHAYAKLRVLSKAQSSASTVSDPT